MKLDAKARILSRRRRPLSTHGEAWLTNGFYSSSARAVDHLVHLFVMWMPWLKYERSGGPLTANVRVS